MKVRTEASAMRATSAGCGADHHQPPGQSGRPRFGRRVRDREHRHAVRDHARPAALRVGRDQVDPVADREQVGHAGVGEPDRDGGEPG